MNECRVISDWFGPLDPNDMLPERLAHLTIRSATNKDRERVTEIVFGVLVEFGLEPDPETTDADL